MKPSQETIENWQKDPNNWKLGIFYFNREDNRVFVPKPIESLGITLNFANPKSYIAICIMIVFFGFILYEIEKNRN